MKAARATILTRLRRAERPVIFAGAGVRLAGAAEEFRQLVERLQIPIVTGFNAHDLVATDHRYYAGRQGTIGDRAGNFAVQNADFLLILGCRLNIRQVSYAWQHFARDAYKVMVDVDAAELAKPTLTIDLPVHADARAMIASLLEGTAGWEPLPAHAHWAVWCRSARRGTRSCCPSTGHRPDR